MTVDSVCNKSAQGGWTITSSFNTGVQNYIRKNPSKGYHSFCKSAYVADVPNKLEVNK